MGGCGGAGSFALFAGVAYGFVVVAVAFDCCCGAAGFGWVYGLEGPACGAGFGAAFVSLAGWCGAAWGEVVSAGCFDGLVAYVAGCVVSFVSAAGLACPAWG